MPRNTRIGKYMEKEEKIAQLKLWIDMENDSIKISKKLIWKNEILSNKDEDNFYLNQIEKNKENIKKFETEINKIMEHK